MNFLATVSCFLRRDDDEEEEVSDESEYEVSDRSEKGGQSEDNDASSQDLSKERHREDDYSDVEEDEDDGVLTRRHVRITCLSLMLPAYFCAINSSPDINSPVRCLLVCQDVAYQTCWRHELTCRPWPFPTHILRSCAKLDNWTAAQAVKPGCAQSNFEP